MSPLKKSATEVKRLSRAPVLETSFKIIKHDRPEPYFWQRTLAYALKRGCVLDNSIFQIPFIETSASASALILSITRIHVFLIIIYKSTLLILPTYRQLFLF